MWFYNNRRDNKAETKIFTGKGENHQGSVRAIQFMNTAFMISSSLDSFLLLWDINSKIVSSYREHTTTTTEVTCLDVNEVNGTLFLLMEVGISRLKFGILEKKSMC